LVNGEIINLICGFIYQIVKFKLLYRKKIQSYYVYFEQQNSPFDIAEILLKVVLNTKNQFKSINQLYYGDEFYWWRKQNTDMLQVNDIYTGTFLLPKTVASLICTNITSIK
jgi:hypothetical protein